MKKISRLLLVVTLVLGTILAATLSAQAAWSGTVATSFYSGNGTKSNPYVVRTESQLAYFAKQMVDGNNFEGQYVSLEKDLDMTGATWTASGKSFAGTFLGNGHTITINARFFYKIEILGKVDWLNLKGTETLTDPLMCEYNYGTIQNCRVEGNVYGDDTSAESLLCYENQGTVVNSSGFGSVVGYGDDCSVWVGWIAKSTGTIKNCYTVLNVSGSAPGRYNTLHKGEITASGTYENCYTSANAVANNAEFVAKLNQSLDVPGYVWAMDTANTNNGYPVIKKCLSATLQLSASTEPMFTYHSSTLTTTISCNVSGCTIYYTLDGSDPTTSTSRKTYGSSLTLSGDTVVTMVAYKGGEYSTVYRQCAVRMLGAGTASNPYQVSTKTEFCAVYLEPDKVYELTCDLDFTNGGYVHNGIVVEEWTPISLFSGTFDGNAHSITGLKSSNGGFIKSNTGVVCELRLLKHQLYKKDAGNFGPLVHSNSGRITRCYAEADPDVTLYTEVLFNYVGGLVGENGGTVSYCSTSGDIRASSSERYPLYFMGGIVGNNYGTVQSCYSDARIYGPSTNHDMGSNTAGIAVGGKVCDCRFDGYCWNGGYDAWIGIAAHNSPGSSSTSAYRTYDGGAVFAYNSGSKVHRYTGNDAYKTTGTGEDLMEQAFPAFDFDTVWMITPDGPMPQGIMQANGKYYTKYSYTAPGIDTTGETRCYVNGGYPLEVFTLPASGVLMGTHGDNLRWKITADGVLTITGTGAMSGDEVYDFPWYYYGGNVIASQITSIVIGSGVTTIAPYAFYKSGATTVSLPNTVTSIGYEAFDRSNITELTLPASLEELDYSVFYGLNVTLTFTGDAPEFSLNTFNGATVTAYYPANNTTWTSDVLQQYGGSVTWIRNGNCRHDANWCSLVGKIEPDCTNSGYSGDKVCGLCGETTLIGSEVSSLGHSEVRNVGLVPTCTEEGYITVTCSRCDYSARKSLEALGHRIQIGEVDPFNVENNSAVPFVQNENTYTSANKSHSSSSEIRITALYDFTLVLTYSVSSETTHDKLTVLLNSTQKDVISGSVSDKVMELDLLAGDVVIVRYSKDGSVSTNKDQGWVALQYEKINLDTPAETVEPTCANDVACDYCQAIVKKALPHTPVTDDAVAPTCAPV